MFVLRYKDCSLFTLSKTVSKLLPQSKNILNRLIKIAPRCACKHGYMGNRTVTLGLLRSW